MKKILKLSSIFLGGLIVGATLMNLLHMYVRPTYLEIIRTHLKVDEDFLGSRSMREKKTFETAFHRWAALNAESEDGFRVFRRIDKQMVNNSFLFPFELLPLKWMWSPDKFKKGRQISEGIERGKFAAALEAVGEVEEAARQWQMAQQLTKSKTIETTKKFIYDILEQEKKDTYIQAEKKILDETN